jgi:hypothetical protein
VRAAQLSITRVSSTDKRIAETGSCPVAGRPLFFRFARIDDFIIYLYYEKVSRARPVRGPAPQHEQQPLRRRNIRGSDGQRAERIDGRPAHGPRSSISPSAMTARASQTALRFLRRCPLSSLAFLLLTSPRVCSHRGLLSAPGSWCIATTSRWKSLLLLGAFRMRRLGMLACILCVLLSLGCVLFALGVVILAVRLRSGAMGLRRGFVMLRRLVVGVFHFDFSCWPTNFGCPHKRPQ